jgi:hypothetical protein
LASALPFWRDELEKISKLSESGSIEARCHDAYVELLATYEKCMTSNCAGAPRLYAEGGGVAGIPDPRLMIPPVCPVAGMRNYASEINDLADRSVVEVLPALDHGWAAEFARFGGLERIRQVVGRGCEARHRRYRSTDIEELRSATGTFLTDLGNTDFTAMWESAPGTVRVSGVGPVKVFARVKVSTGQPYISAAAIEREFRAAAHCSAGNGEIMQAVVIDVDSMEVKFMGLFFDEQLLCEDFLPN